MLKDLEQIYNASKGKNENLKPLKLAIFMDPFTYKRRIKIVYT